MTDSEALWHLETECPSVVAVLGTNITNDAVWELVKVIQDLKAWDYAYDELVAESRDAKEKAYAAGFEAGRRVQGGPEGETL